MGNLERRVERLESASGADWGLTRLLEWIEAERSGQLTADAEEPTGELVECLERLPIATVSPESTDIAKRVDRMEAVADLPAPSDAP